MNILEYTCTTSKKLTRTSNEIYMYLFFGSVPAVVVLTSFSIRHAVAAVLEVLHLL